MMTRFLGMVGWIALIGPGLALGADPVPKVRLMDVPGGGVQPRVATEPSGMVHVVFLRGQPGSSDVYHASWKPGAEGFGPPDRVNSEPGSAMATGTVRGAQIAVGRGGRVHVAWNGSKPGPTTSGREGVPMLYARSVESGSGFEPQRNLMTRTGGLDGGGSVAADDSGHVYVTWHGQTRGEKGEENRRVWIARSTDDGATFSAEQPAWTTPTGACGCCGTGASVDARGNVYLLYRAALDTVGRDMMLLVSNDRGDHFTGSTLQPWRIGTCPMSTAMLVDSPDGIYATWETKGQVDFARIDRADSRISKVHSPTGVGGTRKHPSMAVNARGESVLAWAEGTGWQKGGALAWQTFDRQGQPTGEPGRLDRGIATWGLPAAVALPDGSFAILH